MPDDAAELDRRITDALSALRCARAIVERSATSAARWHEEMAERKLNGLLERRSRSGRDEPPRPPRGVAALSSLDR